MKINLIIDNLSNYQYGIVTMVLVMVMNMMVTKMMVMMMMKMVVIVVMMLLVMLGSNKCGYICSFPSRHFCDSVCTISMQQKLTEKS